MADYPDPRDLAPDPLREAAKHAITALREGQRHMALITRRRMLETAAVELEHALVAEVKR